MASRYSVEPTKLLETLKSTVFKGATNEELMALVVVANEHQLNPFTKQIYAFPDKRGGIVPVVPIDGWAAIINSNPNFDGVEFEWEWNDENGLPISCTAVIHDKRRGHPVKVTEYYAECFRNTEPWKQMPRRMLRHKALMQAGRIAFGLSGITDEDDAMDIKTVVHAEAPEIVKQRKLFNPTQRTHVVVEPDQEQKPEASAEPDDIPMDTPAPATVTADFGKPPEFDSAQFKSLEHAQLAKVLESAGHTFEALKDWSKEAGFIKGCEKWTDINSVAEKDVNRLLNAKDGLVAALNKRIK